MLPNLAIDNPDEQLQRLLQGDEAAFVELVNAHHTSLLYLARAFVRDRAIAEEVVQDTWLAVIAGLPRFEGRASLKTWIFRILTYQAQRRATRERRTVNWSSLISDELDSPTPDFSRFTDRGAWNAPPPSWGRNPEQRLLDSDTLRLLAAAIDTLPPIQRTVVTLRDVEGWDSQEVCDALDLTPGNQRVLLHRARVRLRQHLDAVMAQEQAPLRRGARP